MDQRIPPSPAPSGQEAYPSGFTQLENYNSGVGVTSFPRDLQDTVHAHSQPASRMGTPMNQGQLGGEYDGLPMPYPQGGMPNNYAYPQPPFSQESSPYAQMPEAYSTPATSPPTPSDMMRTRSGTVIPRNSVSKVLGAKGARVEKKPQKKKERVKAVKRIAKLEKPLSEMDAESKVPVVDIESYVNRSAELRQADVDSGKNPGKIKRPMNAFMLYRKAYQNRAKEWCSQHNHQIVSQVCGDSWPLETEQTRNQFTKWARIERDNHQKTFPHYKFTPSKPQKPKYPGSGSGGSGVGGGGGGGGSNRRRNGDDSEEEFHEYEWNRPESRNRSATKTPSSGPDGEWPPRAIPFAPPAYPAMGGPTNPMGPPMPYPHSSSFEMSNPGRPLPMPYDPRAGSDRYYQTQVQQGHMYPGMPVQDVTMRQTPSPGMVFPNGHRQTPTPPMHLAPPTHPQQLNMMQYHVPQTLDYQSLPFAHHHHHHYLQQAHGSHLQPLTPPPPPQEPQIDPILEGLGNTPFDDDGVLLGGFVPATQGRVGEPEQAGQYVPENPFMGNIGDPGTDDAPYLRGNWDVVEDDTGFDMDSWAGGSMPQPE